MAANVENDVPLMKTVERLKELSSKLCTCYKVDKFPGSLDQARGLIVTGAVNFANVLQALEGMKSRTLQQQIVDKINAKTSSFVDEEGNVQLPDDIEWTKDVFVIQNLGLHDFWPLMSERNQKLTHDRLAFIVASAYSRHADPHVSFPRYDEATLEDAAAAPETLPETPAAPVELKDGELEMDEVEEESGSGNLLDQIAGSIGGGGGKAKAGGGQFKIENIFNPKTCCCTW